MSRIDTKRLIETGLEFFRAVEAMPGLFDQFEDLAEAANDFRRELLRHRVAGVAEDLADVVNASLKGLPPAEWDEEIEGILDEADGIVRGLIKSGRR